MNHLARWVRARRKHVLGISQAELARRAGLSKRKIEQFESDADDTEPFGWTLTQLARGLGVPVQAITNAVEGRIDETLGESAGAVFADHPQLVGLQSVPLIEPGDLLGPTPPRYVHVPAEIAVPHPMSASVVRDDTMAPQFLRGDCVVWAEDGELHQHRSHWLRVSTEDGDVSLVRQVLVQRERVTLMPLNPRVEPLHVHRRDLIRWGRIIYVSRPVG